MEWMQYPLEIFLQEKICEKVLRRVTEKSAFRETRKRTNWHVENSLC